MRQFNLVVPYETWTVPVSVTRRRRLLIDLAALVGWDLEPEPITYTARAKAMERGAALAAHKGALADQIEWWNEGPNFIQGRCPWPEPD